MTTAVAEDGVLSEKLTSSSKTSIWRLLLFIFAQALHFHEKIVEKNAENSRPHTARWYRQQALDYMDGKELTWKDGQFKYDISAMTDAEIEAAKVISHVALAEAANGVLVIKTAKDGNAGTVPLEDDVHDRFESYMAQIKDAGNRLSYINTDADHLKLALTVWVDDMIINVNTGESLQELGTFPIKDACEKYLNELEFNGAFIKTYLTDEIQKSGGVKIPKVELLEHQKAAEPFESVDEYVLPYSGHFHYSAINITYKKYNEVA